MKFEFCGHINCPQWFIAQISVLTKITAVKMKLIFSQIILHYLQNADITAKVSKLLNGTGLDYYEMHSVIATLKFILENSVSFNVSDGVLNKELIDLGLPRCKALTQLIENVQSITKTYKSSKDKLVQKSLENVLKTTDNIDIHFSIHELLTSSKTGISDFTIEGNIKNIKVNKPVFAQIELKFRDCIENQNRRQAFIVSAEQLDYLIYELESGLETIQRLEKSQSKRTEAEEEFQ